MEEMSIRQIFPEQLKLYMKIHKKTMSDLVRDLGFKHSTVRDWVRGRTIPRMDKVEALAQYFDCSPSDLLEDKEPIITDELSAIKRELSEYISALSETEAAVLLASLKSALGRR